MSLWLGYLTYLDAYKTVETNFQIKANITRTALQRKLEQHMETIREVSAFIKATDQVSQKDFDEFLNYVLYNREAVKALYTLDAVPHEQVKQWVTDFSLTNWETSGEVTPYGLDDKMQKAALQPYDSHFFLALKWSVGDLALKAGYDFMSRPSLRPFLQQTQKEGKLFVSQVQNLSLEGQNNSPYWVMGSEIMASDLSGRQRPKHIVLLHLDVEAFLTSVLQDLNVKDLSLTLEPLVLPDSKYSPVFTVLKNPITTLEFRTDRPLSFTDKTVPHEGLVFPAALAMGDATLTYTITPMPGSYQISYWVVMIVLMTGIMATSLLSWSHHKLLRTKEFIQSEVDLKTRDLVEAYQSLEGQKIELTKLNRDLEQAMTAATTANKAKSQFLATMSHELRTPLNSIIGYSEILREDAEESGNFLSLSDHDKVLEAGRHLLNLINDVLDLSRMEADRMNLVIDQVNLHDLVKNVAGTTSMLFKKNNNYFIYDCSPQVGVIETDEQRLRQILFNLLSNAAKFTVEGTIRLMVDQVTLDGREVVAFRVQDSGIGMTPEQAETVFDAFAQADSSTSRRYGGTGLGLTISKELANLMEGDITVDTQLGVGSSFRLILPVKFSGANASSAETSKQEPKVQPEPLSQLKSVPKSEPKVHEGQAKSKAVIDAPVSNVFSLPTREAPVHLIGSESIDQLLVNSNDSGPTKILIIDDEATARDITKRHLSGQRVRIFEASNGLDGLELARKEQPDLIILDVMMPDMTGWDVLSSLQNDPTTVKIPVVMCTMVDEAKQGYVLGASDYLRKPVNKEDLVFKLSRCLKAKSINGQPVLIVEDDQHIQNLLQRMLQREGYETLIAGNGYEALSVMETVTPSLILLDLMMPDMDGFTFLEEMRLKEEWDDIPVIVVTAKELTTEDRMRLDGRVQSTLRKAQYSKNQLMDQVQKLASHTVRELKGWGSTKEDGS